MANVYQCDGCGKYFNKRPTITSTNSGLDREIQVSLLGNKFKYRFDICETCLEKFIDEIITFANMTKKISVEYHVEETESKDM